MNFGLEILESAIEAAILIQAHQLSNIKLEKTTSLSKAEIEVEQKAHEQDEIQELKTHLLTILYELERHFQQLNSDLITQSRESERDAWDQQSQQLQTLTVAATIMLTALVNVLIQGVFRFTTTTFVNVAYSLSNASSLALLVFTVILSTEIISKTSAHMYYRSKNYNQALYEAKISLDNELRPQMRSKKSESIISSGKDHILDEKWTKHEEEINSLMKVRDNIHLKLSDAMTKSSSSKPFSQYWTEEWEIKAHLAVMCFYLGTLSMICANAIFMWVFWNDTYGSSVGANLSVIILFASGIIGILTFFRLRLRTLSYVDNVNFYQETVTEESTFDNDLESGYDGLIINRENSEERIIETINPIHDDDESSQSDFNMLPPSNKLSQANLLRASFTSNYVPPIVGQRDQSLNGLHEHPSQVISDRRRTGRLGLEFPRERDMEERSVSSEANSRTGLFSNRPSSIGYWNRPSSKKHKN